ncbi:MAG: glycine betaine ABC transporter substrate-binding protein [Granulosicoccus sp.]
MFKWCRLAGIVGIAILSVGSKTTQAEECGEVTIASMNWASAEIIAEVDKLMLSAAYGCDVQLVTGDTFSIFTSMTDAGTPDILPELWLNTIDEQLTMAISDGKLTKAAEVLSDGGEEGWWIPRYIADEYPEIKTVEDALARPDLFSSSTDDGTGAVHNCPANWNCQISTANLFRAHGAAEKGFTLVDTGSAAGLDASIVSAYKDGAGWLGYYWAPTPLLGRFDMVRLDTEPHDASTWESCIVVRDCANPQVNGWSDSPVYSIVTSSFAARMDGLADYVNRRQWSNQTINALLAWMSEKQATGDEVARHFLENYEGIWSNWIPVELKFKVANGLLK